MSASTGRGGAGNIGPEAHVKNTKATRESLATPTIKNNIFTTGRGGSGNMAKNDPDNPIATRAAQDVDGPANNPESRGEPMHHGRGGEGNKVKRPSEQVAADKDKDATGSGRKPRRASQGLLEKAKEGLSKVRSASGTRKEGAIDEK